VLWWFVLFAALTAAHAIVKSSWTWMLVSAIVFLPFVLYLHATPRFEGVLLVLIFHFIAACFLSAQKKRFAVILMLPSVVLVLRIAVLVKVG